MKRLLTTILALVYLALASGAGVEVHHCMGQVVGAGLHTGLDETGHSDEAGHHCPKCGMVKGTDQSKGCCKDETKAFAGDDAAFFAQAKKLSSGQDVPLPSPALLPVPIAGPAPVLASAGLANGGFQAHAPPLLTDGPPLFVRVCCFRI